MAVRKNSYQFIILILLNYLQEETAIQMSTVKYTLHTIISFHKINLIKLKRNVLSVMLCYVLRKIVDFASETFQFLAWF